MLAVGRIRAREMTRLMQVKRALVGRPPVTADPKKVALRILCAERCLSGDISQAEAAVIYRVSARTIERWVAWAIAHDDRIRRLADQRG